MPTDDELAHLKDLETAWTKARRAFGAKMTELYPNSRRRSRPISDEEANDEIEPFAARAHEAEVALLEARKKLGL
jgi:hypothetical protein